MPRKQVWSLESICPQNHCCWLSTELPALRLGGVSDSQLFTLEQKGFLGSLVLLRVNSITQQTEHPRLRTFCCQCWRPHTLLPGHLFWWPPGVNMSLWYNWTPGQPGGRNSEKMHRPLDTHLCPQEHMTALCAQEKWFCKNLEVCLLLPLWTRPWPSHPPTLYPMHQISHHIIYWWAGFFHNPLTVPANSNFFKDETLSDNTFSSLFLVLIPPPALENYFKRQHPRRTCSHLCCLPPMTCMLLFSNALVLA